MMFLAQGMRILRKRDLYPLQKSPISSAKDPYIMCQRALYLPQKSPISSAKEPYFFRKRALYLPQKRPISSTKKPDQECGIPGARNPIAVSICASSYESCASTSRSITLLTFIPSAPRSIGTDCCSRSATPTISPTFSSSPQSPPSGTVAPGMHPPSPHSLKWPCRRCGSLPPAYPAPTRTRP